MDGSQIQLPFWAGRSPHVNGLQMFETFLKRSAGAARQQSCVETLNVESSRKYIDNMRYQPEEML